MAGVRLALVSRQSSIEVKRRRKRDLKAVDRPAQLRRSRVYCGSGISAAAGIPTWNGLFNSVADALDRDQHDTQVARATATEGKLPEAFDLLAEQTNKSDIHKRIAALVKQMSTPGMLHIQLADWPFRFHVTTNYDHLIENAAPSRLVSVGNRGSGSIRLVERIATLYGTHTVGADSAVTSASWWSPSQTTTTSTPVQIWLKSSKPLLPYSDACSWASASRRGLHLCP